MTCQARCLGPGYVFFVFFCTLLMVFVIYRFYLCIEDMGEIQGGNDRQNRPKQCVSTLFGPLVHVFFMFLCILLMFSLYTGPTHVLKHEGCLDGR